MSTYYMSGCSEDNEAVASYLDSLNGQTMRLMEGETGLQEYLFVFLTTEEDEEDDIELSDEEIHEKLSELKTSHREFIDEIDLVIKDVESVKPIKDEHQIKQMTLKLATAYKEIAKNEYAEVIDILFLTDEELTEKHEEKLSSFLQSIDKNIEPLWEDYYKMLDEVAEKHGLDTEE